MLERPNGFCGRIRANVGSNRPLLIVQIELRVDRYKVHAGIEVRVQRSYIAPIFGILLIHILEIKRIHILVPDEIRDDIPAKIMACILAGVLEKGLNEH